MQYLSFSVWLTSLSLIPSRSIHDFIFYGYVVFHLPIDGHLVCFHILVSWIMVPWTCGFTYLFKLAFSSSSGRYTVMELLDHMVAVLFIFWGASILFSITAVPVYISPKTAQRSPFLHVLASTFVKAISCLFDNSRSDRCAVIICLWLWFAFPWCFVTLSIFSRARWLPSVCLLWENVSAQILIGLSVFGSYWITWVLYIFWS